MLLKNVCTNPRNWWHQRKKNSRTSSSKKSSYSNRSENSAANLTSNISLPQTGEEAMKRLFACKGKDPYRLVPYVEKFISLYKFDNAPFVIFRFK